MKLCIFVSSGALNTEWNCTCNCRLTIFDEVYSGVGSTKLDAKVNAAASAVTALHTNGVIRAREKELQAERREADWLRRHSECPPEIPLYDHRMFGKVRPAESFSIWLVAMYFLPFSFDVHNI